MKTAICGLNELLKQTEKVDAQNDREKRVFGSFLYTLINQNEYDNESEWVLMMNIVKYACSIFFKCATMFSDSLINEKTHKFYLNGFLFQFSKIFSKHLM